jgi:hypothetical protein
VHTPYPKESRADEVAVARQGDQSTRSSPVASVTEWWLAGCASPIAKTGSCPMLRPRTEPHPSAAFGVDDG